MHVVQKEGTLDYLILLILVVSQTALFNITKGRTFLKIIIIKSNSVWNADLPVSYKRT